MSKRRSGIISALAALALATGVLAPGSRGRALPATVRSCPASPVHYQRAPSPPAATLPWVAPEPRSVGLVGRLFYYEAYPSVTWGRRHIREFRIYTGGRSPDGRVNMKILWTAPPPLDERALVVRGARLGGGHFTQRLAVGPSIVKVPRPGCWRLSLSLGRVTTRLTVLAVRGRVGSV
jgi:hypothetical protein